jgi:hypothetical protein
MVLGHSGYMNDPHMHEEVDALAERLLDEGGRPPAPLRWATMAA